jgi:aminoglycoside phosphotransferase (APT) family kinase protein
VTSEVDDVVRSVTGRAPSYVADPVPLRGGFWASLWTFELAEPPPGLSGPLVLRLMPDVIAGERETAVQAAMSAGGFATPAVLASGRTPDGERAWSLMAKVSGAPPLGALTATTAVRTLRSVVREVPPLLARVMADLHATAVGDLALASPERHLAAIEASSQRPLVHWLREQRRDDATHVLCHGDLHPFNVLVDGANTWVLDWTAAVAAPREMDVGFTAGLLRCPPLALPGALQPVLRRIGERLAEGFVDAYAHRIPVDRHAVTWWEAVQLGRCVAEVEQGRLPPRHPFVVAHGAMRRRIERIVGQR